MAVLDQTGTPIPQSEAFGFFDLFRLPHVACRSYPVSELEAVVAGVRTRTDNEGAVIYLEDAYHHCIGLAWSK